MKFSVPGIYTLQCSANVTGNSSSARVSVNVLAAGANGTNAPIQLRQGLNGYSHLATFIRQDWPNCNSGVRDQILVGRNTSNFRTLLVYDLSSLPTNTLVTGVQLDLWTHGTQAGAGSLGPLELHSLAGTPVEGTGDGSTSTSGTGTGAMWLTRTGGTKATDLWTNGGGDFATNIISASPGFSGTNLGDAFSFFPTPDFSAAAQNAVNSGQPWNLLLSSPATEMGANTTFARICSDDYTTLTNRPMLTLSFDGNFAPAVSAGLAPAATTGMSAPLNGSVSNATSSAWSQLSGPGVATFGDATSPATSVLFSAPGAYVLRLVASNAFAQVVSDLGVTVAGRPLIGSLIVSNGQFGFQVTGATGVSYTVQASTNLATWTNLFTTNPLALPFGWVDSQGNIFSRRFYRVLLGQ